MKTIKNRMKMAMITVLFTASVVSCTKENNVQPAPDLNSGNQQPAESINQKPLSIITKTSSGTIISREIFTYENNLLVKYILNGISRKDSMLIVQDSNHQGVEAFFTFAGRTFRSETVLGPGKQIAQSSTSKTSSRMADIVTNNSFLRLVIDANSSELIMKNIVYTGDNISSYIIFNDTVSITYYDELDYQKGIIELPTGLPMFRHSRLLELNNMTNTKVFSKLIKSIRSKNANSVNNLFINNYSYTFDSNGRIKEIRDNLTFGTIGTVFTNSTTIKTISYE